VPNSDRITIRDLLRHTSGVFDYTDRLPELYPTIDDILRIRYRYWSPRDILAIIDGLPPRFEPGTQWSYSNTNYILLAQIIKRVTGRDYSSEVERRILRPLRLGNTEVPGNTPFIKGPHAHGYEPALRNGVVEPVDITVFNPSIAWAAGELTSTTTDLNRFYGALMRGRLLNPSLLAEMRTSFADADYGLGLETFQLPCTRLWGHTGGIFGFLTLSVSTPDGRRQLTLSLNPWINGDPGPPLIDLLLTAFCEPSDANRAAVALRPPRFFKPW
jgi:D-alanyl-D-alanine carboxypeptidase